MDQSLTGGDVTVRDYIQTGNKANEEAGRAIFDTVELIDPTGFAMTVMGRGAGVRDDKDVITSVALVFATRMTSEAINVVKGAGTHEVLEVTGELGKKINIIPTRQEAEKLIAYAGGRIERIEKAHQGAGHAYAHINYLTAKGEKATIRVQSVGKEFHRTPKKKIGNY